MAKVFKITPKEEKQLNGVGISPSMEVYIIAHSDAPDPFHDGGVEVREGFMKWHGVDIQDCDAEDFEVEALEVISASIFFKDKAIIQIASCPFSNELKSGVIDDSGKFIIPPIYDSVSVSEYSDYIAVGMGIEWEYEDGEYGYSEPGDWGIIDSNNHFLVPLKYSSIDILKNNLFVTIDKYKKWGAINIYDEIVIPFEYDYIDRNLSAQKGKKWGCISEKGEVLIPFIYDWLSLISEEFISVKYKGKYGIINYHGETVIPFENEHECHINFDSVGCLGMIDIDEDIIIQENTTTLFKYNVAGYADKYGYILARKGEKYGCLSEKGKVLIPLIYDFLSLGGNHEFILVENEGERFYIDRKGKRVLL